MTENSISRKIDASGWYIPAGQEAFLVERATDLAKRGVVISDRAILETPGEGWGKEGLEEYRRIHLELKSKTDDQQHVIVDFEHQIED